MNRVKSKQGLAASWFMMAAKDSMEETFIHISTAPNNQRVIRNTKGEIMVKTNVCGYDKSTIALNDLMKLTAENPEVSMQMAHLAGACMKNYIDGFNTLGCGLLRLHYEGFGQCVVAYSSVKRMERTVNMKLDISGRDAEIKYHDSAWVDVPISVDRTLSLYICTSNATIQVYHDPAAIDNPVGIINLENYL